ncbi:hypothetical protein [Poseidonibacter ostreae]|uniref:Uncharacterized protein n=1 Tax=Poseidonibacter ostreae TaxID=2654171 RepID=A0A6L4WWR9_9BACT|nr:hypothetical protein [Poseidonibacter ostreae]KAB7891331.1 hypothetical protein GBG19_00410 [Poseidonibacter ostreae]
MTIYNVLPSSVDDLINNELLPSGYSNTEFGKRASLINGVISFASDGNNQMTDELLTSNSETLKANSYKANAQSIRKQKKTINLYNSVMTDSTITNKNYNSNIADLTVTDLSKDAKNNNTDILNIMNGL